MHTGEQSYGFSAKMTLFQGVSTFLDIFGFVAISAVFCVKILLTPFRGVKYKLIYWGDPVVFTLLRNLALQEGNF